MYTEKNLAAIAKRENNTKRKYLVVNRMQGKHIPVSPALAVNMFHALAGTVKPFYKEEKLLLVGFAETATAIGAQLAIDLDGYYMQTTREIIPDVEYLYFSESHSHATEQKLVRDDLDKIIDKIDRIIFVEDEVTTGNTILNIIRLIKNTYINKKNLQFSVASILNGMNEEAAAKYREQEIKLHYLVKTNHDKYTEIAEKYSGDGKYISCAVNENDESLQENCRELICAENYINARRLTDGKSYLSACKKLWNFIRETAGDGVLVKNKTEIGDVSKKNILVLGTEEFMFPALFAAARLEETGCRVRFHATTRSPIAVSSEPEYPLHRRYELKSPYDRERVTYVYELENYDQVLLITDADQSAAYILAALKETGNRNITIIRWRTDR